MINRAAYLFIGALLMMLTGCTLEQKLSRNFIELEKSSQFVILQPDIVFKYNLKEFEVPGVDTLDEISKNAVLLENSLFLKAISDSLLIEDIVSGFVKALRNYGMEVYFESDMDTLLAKGGTPYIINLAQISLEEYIHPYSSEEYVYDEAIVISGIDLDAINYNLWLEISRLNTEKENKVLFASDYLLDDLNGTLKQNLLTGKLSFDYTLDTINTDRIYEFGRRFGKTMAGYLFDYLMNTYIGENLPEEYPYDRYYYHYDRDRKITYPVSEEERFIELQNN